jgi:hypothetical protein
MFHQDTVSSFKDLHTSDTGIRATSGSKKEHFDVDTTRTAHGHNIELGLQQVIDGNNNMFNRLRSATTDGERRAEIAAITQAVGGDLGNFIGRSGLSRDYVNAQAGMDASIGAKGIFGGAAISGAARVGGERADTYNTNLQNREISERLTHADQEARNKGLKGEMYNDYMMSSLQGHVGKVMDKVAANNPEAFGASAPGEFGMKAMKSGWEGAKEMYNKFAGDK